MKSVIIGSMLVLFSVNAFSSELKDLKCYCFETSTLPADPNYGQWPGDDENNEGTYRSDVLARCYVGNDFDSAADDKKVEILKAVFTSGARSEIDKKVKKICPVAKKQAQIVLSSGSAN
ncbi:hypothetical protein [Bdellovibrio sp. HCB2-146]|uniref:hypothetical protein n=1 Tax=Bdellovibrio sp. HCB2-146 TaxID=3394362 RepID=UPI0039BC5043